MFQFLLRYISSSWIRAFSIVCASLLSLMVLIVFYFSYINLVEGIRYYTLEGIDEKRFTITQSATLFQLLDRSAGGIHTDTQESIKNDPYISRYKEFHFIDIPVLGTFNIFNFGLQIDIPTFTITDSKEPFDGVGISSSMIHYYNLEFAGTNIMFPTFTPANVLGKKVTLQFGASKIFNLAGGKSGPIESTITHIEPDFPGFGVVISTEAARQKMTELGMTLNPPYKIIAYMKDPRDRSIIESQYRDVILRFDADLIREKEHTFFIIAAGFLCIGSLVIGSIYAFLFLLFLAYFREKEYAYRLISRYKIDWKGSLLLLLSEPILLLLVACIFGLILYFGLQNLILTYIGQILISYKVLVPVIPIPILTVISIFSLNLIFALILLLFSYRKKSSH